MAKRHFPRRNRTTPRTHALKEAIVASFVLPGDAAVSRLAGFGKEDWQSVLWWLDVAGMALYFLERVRQLGIAAVLPRGIEQQLDRRLDCNRTRIGSLRQEAVKLASLLDNGSIAYALLKGMTLEPDSVSDQAYRCQTDLDFLVAERDADAAIDCIAKLGYRLHAKSGNTMEFRAGEASLPDMANLYSVRTQRALELHIAPEAAAQWDLLSRRLQRVFDGAAVATLSPADIYVQQALHLLKHLCGEHTRLSWVLEFRRHTVAKEGDAGFWSQVELAASREPLGSLAIGVALWVAEAMFPHPALAMPKTWNRESLPPRVHLWLERYVRNLLLSDSIGSKLYALLRNEIHRGPNVAGRTRKILLPHYLPKPILEPKQNERWLERLERYAVEADFFFRRLSFHLAEGIRFGVEASRWRKATTRCEP